MRTSRFILLFAYACWKIIQLSIAVFLNYIFHPSKLFQKRKTFTRPPILQDDSLGLHQSVTVNGIKLHCVISGPENAPPMLMLHGYPEFWYSWRYQIREFNKDYRVIAVDLRGYGESDKPAKTAEYAIYKFVDDIIGLIELLDCGKCTMLAHDWGGIFAWGVVLRRPDLVDKLIVMCSPHPGRYNELANAENDTLLRQWYIFLHCIPWIPEKLMSMDNFAFFQKVFKSRRTGFTNRNQLSQEDMQAFLYTFSQPGALTPALNIYRNVARDPMLKDETKYDIIQVPTLILFGQNDPFLSPRLAQGHDKYVQYWEAKILNGGHWLQQDCAEEVNGLVKEFCNKTFD